MFIKQFLDTIFPSSVCPCAFFRVLYEEGGGVCAREGSGRCRWDAAGPPTGHLPAAPLLTPRLPWDAGLAPGLSETRGQIPGCAPKLRPPLHPHRIISHGGKAGCVYLDKRYIAIIELLIMSNNFFLKQTLPRPGLESISGRGRRGGRCFPCSLIDDGVIILACSQVALSVDNRLLLCQL